MDLELRGMSCLKECSHVSNSSAKTSPKRFVAANVEQIRDLGEKRLFHSRQTREFKDA